MGKALPQLMVGPLSPLFIRVGKEAGREREACWKFKEVSSLKPADDLAAGLARRIVTKAGAEPTGLLELTDKFIRSQPQVSGDSSQVCPCSLHCVLHF
jgi:hypothetical protein